MQSSSSKFVDILIIKIFIIIILREIYQTIEPMSLTFNFNARPE